MWVTGHTIVSLLFLNKCNYFMPHIKKAIIKLCKPKHYLNLFIQKAATFLWSLRDCFGIGAVIIIPESRGWLTKFLMWSSALETKLGKLRRLVKKIFVLVKKWQLIWNWTCSLPGSNKVVEQKSEEYQEVGERPRQLSMPLFSKHPAFTSPSVA